MGRAKAIFLVVVAVGAVLLFGGVSQGMMQADVSVAIESGGASQGALQTAATSPYVGEPLTLEERIARTQEARAKIVTQEDREGASARREALLGGIGALSIPVVGPLDQPDFFGSANWAFSPELRKFVDTLPGLGAANASTTLGTYIPVAVPDTTTYPGCDYYELSVREFSQKVHTDLAATTFRGYVQTNYGTNPLTGLNTVAPAPIMYLGPQIVAQKDRPVRIKFTNELPVNAAGKLFIPVDTTVMGSGWGPLQGNAIGTPWNGKNYSQNRAVIHLHGGHTPWISDGTPHQWITPAGENTSYPEGVSVQNVPDMPDPGEGSQTYYFSNQQSSRLLFYHDHSWGITRLNVYVGEAAGYLIRDSTEEDLITRGVIPSGDHEVPLIIQDKSFVDAPVVRATDPTWNWGTGALDTGTGIRAPKTGDLWYPHVYSPAQNPYDLEGVNAFGRWHYGPWFWPPTTDTVQPVTNAYAAFDGQPPMIPGVPWVSAPGESYFDTALVNGAAFPTMTVDPTAYRFRILNASNDRFWNLQMYVADPTQISSDSRLNTEIKMVPAASTAGFPANWPTDGREGGVPDPTAVGPDWIQIGTEGGFLPQPAVIPNQPITWNNVPTTFNFGNVDKHSLLVAPAERADVIVDFSQYAGQTLIVYNDAPAAFPAGDPRYDYYAGSPDLTGEGGYIGTEVGFGPNTRTVMQIKVSGTVGVNGTEYPLAALQAEFVTTSTQDGVFKRSQNPILVGQTAYDSTYDRTFPTSWPTWGYSRIQDTSLTFETLAGTTLTLPMQPKALHDEMGAAYDEYGRMSGKLGLEISPATALTQNFVLQNFVDPVTEIIEDSMTPMSPVLGDGTQIWKITHNGVDTHPIHFHLFDVQLLNRVGWDGMIRLPDANELGWKDTVRVSPLEDTIVALRATASKQPFGQPDSIRPLNPAQPLTSPMGFSKIDPYTGQALNPPTLNAMVNFGWEYVWHCHILSHEEMDMMRPMKFNAPRALAVAPVLGATGTTGSPVVLSWTDGTPFDYPLGLPTSTLGNPANEVGFRIERATVVGGVPGAYSQIGTALANHPTYVDSTTSSTSQYSYRVTAYNAAGNSVSNVVQVGTVTALPTIRYEETDPLLIYSGSWANFTSSSYSAGGMKQTSINGSTVTINFTGTKLTWITRKFPSSGRARVTLDGGTPVTVDLYSPTQLYQQAVWTTGTLANGNHKVVIAYTGQKNPSATFTYVNIDAVDVTGVLTGAAGSAPAITSVSPSSGPAIGGSGPVTITGTNFTGASAVAFGPTAVPLGGFTVSTSSQIVVTNIPPGTGTVDVRVTTPAGPSAIVLADQYTYAAAVPAPTITLVNPATGPAIGGAGPVTITGTNFTGATAVTFGLSGVLAGGFSVVNSTTISVTNIPGGTGTVDVRVTTPGGGTSAIVTQDKYTYLPPVVPAPTITNISPISGPALGGSGPVTITGTNFTGATGVTFGLSAVLAGGFTVNSSSQITVTNIPSGTGTVDVRVTTPGGGTSAIVTADQYTYLSTVRYEETDSHLIYSGSWANFTGASYSAGSMKQTSINGSTVTIKFTGTSLTWITRKFASSGRARVTLDGGTPVTVDLYSATQLYQQPVWTTGTLTNGPHTVVISWTGLKNPAATFTYVNIDAVDVTGVLN